MKRIIVSGAVAALATVTFAGAANAAGPADAACFGQVHKAVNSGFLGDDVPNVGTFVQGFDNKGQGKNAVARSLCA